MKFKIKKSYIIMGHKIKVKTIDTNDFAGLYDNNKNTIYISANQTEKEKILTLYHECFHALQYKTGVHQAVSRELLEVLAETSSHLLFDFIHLK